MDEKQIQEMQFVEQNLQNILLQKQAFQMELSESNLALKELESSGEEVYKVIGQLMLKTEKANLKKELEDKQKILELRLKSLEKQEANFTEKLEKFREDFLKSKKK